MSIRAVAREAGVALGLVNYHFEDKTSLIRAALHRVEEQDLALVEPDPELAPRDRLLIGLRRFAEPEYLTTEYLSLRLQLTASRCAAERRPHVSIVTAWCARLQVPEISPSTSSAPGHTRGVHSRLRRSSSGTSSSR